LDPPGVPAVPPTVPPLPPGVTPLPPLPPPVFPPPPVAPPVPGDDPPPLSQAATATPSASGSKDRSSRFRMSHLGGVKLSASTRRGFGLESSDRKEKL